MWRPYASRLVFVGTCRVFSACQVMSARNGKIIAATDRCRGRAHSGQGENGNESYLTRKWCSWYTYSVDTRKGKQGGYNGT